VIIKESLTQGNNQDDAYFKDFSHIEKLCEFLNVAKDYSTGLSAQMKQFLTNQKV
jgi:hypothetical protein